MNRSNNFFSFMDSINSALFERDCDIFDQTTKVILEGSSSPLQYGINTMLMRLPKKMILDAYSNLCTISSNGGNLIHFYEELYKSPKLNETNNTVTVFDIDEIEAIKPQYLNLFIKRCVLLLDKAINEDLSDSDIDAISDPKYITTLKRHLAITTLPEYISDKNLAKLDNKTCINVTSTYITGRILPFLRSLPICVKELDKTIKATMSEIDAAVLNMNDFIATVNDLISNKRIKSNDMLNRLTYKISSILLELCKYLLALLMRKANTYINNIVEYDDLKTTFERYYSGNEYQLGESVIDGDYENNDFDIATSLIRGDASIQLSIIDKIFNKYKTFLLQDKSDDLKDSLLELDSTDIRNFPFDKSPYVNCTRMNKMISESLNELNILMKNPDTPIQDIKDSMELLYDIECKLRDPISRITVIDFYNGVNGTNASDIIYSIMNELKNASTAMEIIARGFKLNDLKIETLKRNLSLNVNDEYSNHERNEEMMNELDEIQNRFHNFALLVGDGFNKRFRLLENSLSINMNHENIINDMTESDTTDYLSISMEHVYTMNEMFREYVAEKKYMEFSDKFNKKSSGSIFAYFEAEDMQQSSQNGQQKTSKAHPVQTQNNGNGRNTTPKVVDNSQNNAQQPSQTVSNNNDGNNSSDKKLDKTYTDGICSELSRAIRELIDKLKKAFGSVGKKNKEMLDAGKEEMINRSYNNIQANDLLPFSADDIISQIDGIMKVIGILTPQEVKTMSKDGLEDKLLGQTKEKEAPGKSIGERLCHIFKFGKNNKNPKPQTVANGDLKAKVPEMIDYCQKYYGEFQQQLEKIQTQVDAIMNQLSTKVISDNTTNDGNGAENIKYISNIISTAIGSAMNASRDKANAYMVVLTPFIPDSAKQNATGNTQQQNTTQANQAQPSQQTNTETNPQQNNQNIQQTQPTNG